MINTTARREAKQMANGAEAQSDTNEKIVLYGLLARSLSVHSPKTVKLHPARGLNELEDRLADALRNIAHDGYRDLDAADRKTIEDIFLERNAKARDMRRDEGATALFGLERLRQGAYTGARREMITLRTIAREIDHGNPVSHNGLLASSRVPFKLAMLHLQDLNYETSHRETWKPHTNIRNHGEVFVPDATSFDYINGLNFLPAPPSQPADTLSKVANPQIGCPVTLIDGYVAAIHEVAVEAALASRLLSTA